MQTSAAGREFIEKCEGLYLHAYDDGGGVCTIGYGHTRAAGLPEVHYGMTCTEIEADEWLAADLGKVEADVDRLVKVPLTQTQFDVLVSFQFNTGALAESTLLRKLNAGNYAAVPAELARWNKVKGRVVRGLVKRRAAEAKMWGIPASAWQSRIDWLRNVFGGRRA